VQQCEPGALLWGIFTKLVRIVSAGWRMSGTAFAQAMPATHLLAHHAGLPKQNLRGLHHATAGAAQFCAEKRGQIAIRLRIGRLENCRAMPRQVHHRWGSVADPASGRGPQREKTETSKLFIYL